MVKDEKVRMHLQLWRSAPPGRWDRWGASRPGWWGWSYGTGWTVLMGAPLLFVTGRTGEAWLMALVGGLAVSSGILLGVLQMRQARVIAEALDRFDGSRHSAMPAEQPVHQPPEGEGHG